MIYIYIYILLIYFGGLFATLPRLIIKILYACTFSNDQALWVETRTGHLTLFYSKSELSNSTIMPYILFAGWWVGPLQCAKCDRLIIFYKLMVLIDHDKTFKNNIKKIKNISIGTRGPRMYAGSWALSEDA